MGIRRTAFAVVDIAAEAFGKTVSQGHRRAAKESRTTPLLDGSLFLLERTRSQKHLRLPFPLI
jgi:hypothetical protein